MILIEFFDGFFSVARLLAGVRVRSGESSTIMFSFCNVAVQVGVAGIGIFSDLLMVLGVFALRSVLTEFERRLVVEDEDFEAVELTSCAAALLRTLCF